MAVLYSNNASTTLSASITNSATSLTVAAGKGALFPAISGSDYFYITLVAASGVIEIMKVTARSADVFTVTRGQDGTTAVAWAAGDRVELRFNKALLDDVKAALVSGATFADWNVANPNLAQLISTSTNGVNGVTNYVGMHFPHASLNYGFQIAGRNDSAYYRTLENGTYTAWRAIAHSATQLYTFPVLDNNLNLDSGQQDKVWATNIGTATDRGTKPANYAFVVNLGGRAASGLQIAASYGGSDNFFVRRGSDNGGSVNGANAWQPWYTLLHSGNYSSYAAAASHTHSYLPLSGGTLTGKVFAGSSDGDSFEVRNDTASAASSGYITFKNKNSSGVYRPAARISGVHVDNAFDGDFLIETYSGGVAYKGLRVDENSNVLFYDTSGNVKFQWDAVNSRALINDNVVLHAGNVSSYALPLSGGTLTGQTIFNSGAVFFNDGSSRAMYLKGSGNIIQFCDADGTFRWENVGRNGTYYIYKGYGTGSGYKFQIDDSGNITINNGSGSTNVSGTLNVSADNVALALTGAQSRISFRDADLQWTGYVGFSGNTGQLSFPGRNVEINSAWNGQITLNTGASGYNSGTVAIPYGNLTVQGNTALHAGNFSSYALPNPGSGTGGRVLVNLSGNPSWSDASFTYDPIMGQFRATNFRANVGDAAPTWNFNAILHAGNYTGFSGHLRAGGGNDGMDFNTLAYNTMYYAYISDSPNRPGNRGYSYGTILTFDPGQGTGGRAQFYVSHAGNDLIFRGGWGGNDSWQTWNRVLTDQNYSSYALPLSGGTMTGRLYHNEWIQFNYHNGLYSPQNSAHLFPNDGSYGSWKIYGTRNGWAGLNFGNLNNGDVALMVYPNSNETGFLNAAYGWQFRWNNGTAYVHKNTYGGGTEATVLDSSNYTNYTDNRSVSNVNRIKTFFIDSMSADGTQARRYEVARIAIDYNDWNAVGSFEIEVHEISWSSGIKKRYTVNYGYGGTQSISLSEMTGVGANYFRAAIGSPVQVSGDHYYLPVYVDVGYYVTVAARITTSRNISTDTVPPIGSAKIFTSPSGSNISDHGADSVVTLSSIASALTLGGYTLLHAGNYSSYALPIGGGTLTGSRSINFNTSNGWMYATGDSGGWAMGHGFYGSSGTFRGGFGAMGGGNDLSYFFVGADYNNASMTWNYSDISAIKPISLGGRSNSSTFGGNTYGMSGNAFVAEVRAWGNKPTLTFHYENVATTHIEHLSDGSLNVWRPSNEGTSVFKVGGNVALHAGNYIDYVPISTDGGANKVLKTASNGYLYLNNWMHVGGGGLFSSNNSAHWYPADGSYGAWKMSGSRNGWSGIAFGGLSNGEVTLMVNPNSNETGFHNPSYGWQILWSGGTLYNYKNSYGGGTQAAVLDSSNYSGYALPLSGGTVTGIITTVSSGTAINFSGQSDSFGYNATSGLGTYIKGTGNTYLYGGGSFYDGSTQRALLHAGNYTSYAASASHAHSSLTEGNRTFSAAGAHWGAQSNTTSYGGIQLRDSGNTIKGYLYWENSSSTIGITNFSGTWIIKANNTAGYPGGVLYGPWVVASSSTTTSFGIFTANSTSTDWNAGFNNTNSSTQNFLRFLYATSQIGSVVGSNTSVTYNTSSDYRLKNITGPVTAAEAKAFVMALEPEQGTWLADGSRFVGFVAHKFQQVSPSSVTGVKDAVDEQGKPIYQAMQAASSEVMANLIALVQAQQLAIEELTNRLNQLQPQP